MILGIVGHEAAKFTEAGERRARQAIRELFRIYKPHAVSSGHCHLGGIDIWAEEEAQSEEYNLYSQKLIFAPKRLVWPEFKARNIRIAEASDVVVCICVDKLPPDYKGMRFPLCYHCAGRNEEEHVKSGGCWTTKYARSIGKETELVVVRNEG